MEKSLFLQHLQSALAPHPIRHYESVGSTNDVAMEWLIEGASTGSIVIADEQTKGRGRKQRQWITRSGTAIALSIILHPSPDHLHHISMLAAVAVAELLAHLGLEDVGIKWANDVQVAGRKIAGILPEASWENGRLQGVVVGIGINVGGNFAGTGLENTAASIQDITGIWDNVVDLLEYLVARIDHWTARLGSDEVYTVWKSRLTTIGQSVTVDNVSGLAIDVDDDGVLLIQTESGDIQRVIAGDVMLKNLTGDGWASD